MRLSVPLTHSYSVEDRKIKKYFIFLFILKLGQGQPPWLSGLAPPSAWGVILKTRDQVPRWAPCMEPASPSACVSASLSLSLSFCHE